MIRRYNARHDFNLIERPATSGEKVIHRAGFLRRDGDGNVSQYLILPEVFRREVCAGFHPESVPKALLERGFLDPNGKGRLQKKPRITALGGTVWVYAIKTSILGRGYGDKGDTGDSGHLPCGETEGDDDDDLSPDS